MIMTRATGLPGMGMHVDMTASVSSHNSESRNVSPTEHEVTVKNQLLRSCTFQPTLSVATQSMAWTINKVRK